MSVRDKTVELAAAIRGTQEFQELKQARAVIERDRTLKSQAEEMEKRQTELYNSKLTEAQFKARAEELNRKLGELSQVPEMNRFLKASRQVGTLLDDVYKNLNTIIANDLKSR